MKKEITLKFITDDQSLNASYDEIEIKKIMMANELALALHDIGNEIFRPARKHGYQDAELNKLRIKMEENHDYDKE